MKLLRTTDDNKLMWYCPGCECYHFADQRWNFNGNFEKPSFTPSFLVRSGHHIPEHTGECWCTYNAAHPGEPASFACGICHTVVTDGQIQFLSDCTHKLAGQTVPMSEED